MPGVRRSQLAVEARRRNDEQRIRIGGEIRTMRERRGWTRTELARRAGIGRMVESRVERGTTNLDVDVLQRIAVAMDRPLLVTFGRDLLEAPADAGHLAMQELVLRVGRGAGYSGTFELPTRPNEPWRSVDVGLTSATEHRMVLVECWNTFGDIGAAARSTNRKGSELHDLAVGRWGDGAQVGIVWVVRATARNHALLLRYPEVFNTRFPSSSRAWLEALTQGTTPPDKPGLIWSDVGATRLYEWRRPSPLRTGQAS
jgi:transcriptional regulator with XRE-family HTH domain